MCGRRKCPRCAVKRSLSALLRAVLLGEGNPYTRTGLLSLVAATLNVFSHSLRSDLEQPRERDSARHMGSAQYRGCAHCAPVSMPALPALPVGVFKMSFYAHARTQAHERQAAARRCSCCLHAAEGIPQLPSPLPTHPLSVAPGGCVSNSEARKRRQMDSVDKAAIIVYESKKAKTTTNKQNFLRLCDPMTEVIRLLLLLSSR